MKFHNISKYKESEFKKKHDVTTRSAAGQTGEGHRSDRCCAFGAASTRRPSSFLVPRVSVATDEPRSATLSVGLAPME